MFENPRRGRQARNLTINVPKIPGLKSSSEQVFSENWRWVPLTDRSTKLDKEEQNMKWKKEICLELRAYFCELTCKTDRSIF